MQTTRVRVLLLRIDLDVDLTLTLMCDLDLFGASPRGVYRLGDLVLGDLNGNISI